MIRTWGHWLHVLIHRWIQTLNRLSIGGWTMKIEPGWRKPVGVALGAVLYPGPFLLHSAMLMGRYSLKSSLLLQPPYHGGKLWNHELKWIFPLLCCFTELTAARNYQTHALGSTDKDGDDGTILLVSLAEKASLNWSCFKGRWQVCHFTVGGQVLNCNVYQSGPWLEKAQNEGKEYVKRQSMLEGWRERKGETRTSERGSTEGVGSRLHLYWTAGIATPDAEYRRLPGLGQCWEQVVHPVWVQRRAKAVVLNLPNPAIL